MKVQSPNPTSSFDWAKHLGGLCCGLILVTVLSFALQEEHRAATSSPSNSYSEAKPQHDLVEMATKTVAQPNEDEPTQQKQKPKGVEECSGHEGENVSFPKELAVSDKVIFYHLGKAAGGTIFKAGMLCTWRMVFEQCHPHPCSKGEDTNKTILVNLRDPVDRFISSFHWEMHRHCSEGDTRKGCLDYERNGYKKVVYNYEKDPNKLAEALCSSDKKTGRKAEKHLRVINHMGHDIVDWLKPELLRTKHADRVFPIVMDSSVDVMEQTDHAVVWLHNQTRFENDADFSKRQELVRKMKQGTEKGSSGMTKFVHHASGSENSILTPENKKCMLRFYKKDYKALAKIQRNLCKTKACEEGIQSILDRRAAVLSH